MKSFSPRLYKYEPWLVKALIPEGYKGTYILYSWNDGEVKPTYIGRSDTDLQRRLINHPYLNKTDFFEFHILESAEKCFLSEAALYHCFKGDLLNSIHPASPAFSTLSCPFCTNTYRKTISNRLIAKTK